jgi:hypothetical protein
MRAYIRAPALCVFSRCATPDTLEIRLQIDLNSQRCSHSHIKLNAVQRSELIRSKLLSSKCVARYDCKWLKCPAQFILKCKIFVKRTAVEATLYIRFTAHRLPPRTEWIEQ